MLIAIWIVHRRVIHWDLSIEFMEEEFMENMMNKKKKKGRFN